MHDPDKTKQQLLDELDALRQRVALLEERDAERSRMDQQLQESEATNQALLAAVPDLLFHVRGDGTFLGYAGCTESLYVPPEQFLGKKVSEILPPSLAESLVRCGREATASGRLQLCEYALEIAGECRWWEARVVACGPDEVLHVIREITSRKCAEAALREAHDDLEKRVAERTADLVRANGELQAIYDGMGDGLLIADVETMQFIRANAAICRMLGYTGEEMVTKSVRDIHPASELPAVVRAFSALRTGQTGVGENVPVLRKDGTVFYADIAANHLVFGGRTYQTGFFRDVTERRRAQEALRKEHQTLKHLLQASDHERQTIAYDIHDGLAQQLAGAIMQFQTFGALQGAKPRQAASAFRAGVTILQQGHHEARRLIAGVRPPILDESGVVAAVSHLINELGHRKGPKVEYFNRVEFDRLVPILENAIYRIAQEALANACQHSRSAKVRVSLLQREDRVRIEVRDWGTGFDPNGVRENAFGLEGIRQRARLLGGKCHIRSKPGEGTRVLVELPVVERAEGE